MGNNDFCCDHINKQYTCFFSVEESLEGNTLNMDDCWRINIKVKESFGHKLKFYNPYIFVT